jgi:hypothetical protein
VAEPLGVKRCDEAALSAALESLANHQERLEDAL